MRFILSLPRGFAICELSFENTTPPDQGPASGEKHLSLFLSVELTLHPNGSACLLSLINAKLLLALPEKEMKGCRDVILSTLIFKISYIFAAISLQLLIFSYTNQAFSGNPAGTILLPPGGLGPDGDGTSCIKMRDPLHSFDDHDQQSLAMKKKMQKQRCRKWAAAGSYGSRGRGLIISKRGRIGSTPPKCVSKCSKCTPCMAVRVPIQPGRTKVSLMEYYPEAWRCKCKNKLYMP